MLTRFDIHRIQQEAKAAAQRGETFEQASQGYARFTPAWSLFHRVHTAAVTAHRISSLIAATDPAARLLSSGSSVDPADPADNVQIP